MENEGSSVGARGPNGVSTNAKLPFLLPFGKKASVGRGPISGVRSAKQAELDRLFASSDAPVAEVQKRKLRALEPRVLGSDLGAFEVQPEHSRNASARREVIELMTHNARRDHRRLHRVGVAGALRSGELSTGGSRAVAGADL